MIVEPTPDPGRPRKVLVLVLSFDKEPHRSIEIQGQRQTWAAAIMPDMPVLYYYGVTSGLYYWTLAFASKTLHELNQQRLRNFVLRQTGCRSALRTRETGDRIDVRIPDFYGTIGAKMVGALRHVLKFHPFDYLFRTNTSSYVHRPGLQQFVQSLPTTRYYAGALGKELNTTFVGGAGILLSRDLVELAANDPAWDWDLMDDLALARSLARAGVTPKPFPRIDIASPDQVPLVAAEQWENCFHVRCRSANDRRQDIETMKAVHAAYLKTKA